eukprot:3504507-Pleurochrysis_carterae.AAC.2
MFRARNQAMDESCVDGVPTRRVDAWRRVASQALRRPSTTQCLSPDPSPATTSPPTPPSRCAPLDP